MRSEAPEFAFLEDVYARCVDVLTLCRKTKQASSLHQCLYMGDIHGRLWDDGNATRSAMLRLLEWAEGRFGCGGVCEPGIEVLIADPTYSEGDAPKHRPCGPPIIHAVARAGEWDALYLMAAAASAFLAALAFGWLACAPPPRRLHFAAPESFLQEEDE